jgi:hypothetical protein
MELFIKGGLNMATGTRSYKITWKLSNSGRKGSMTAVLSETEEREVTRALHELLRAGALADCGVEPAAAPSDFDRVQATLTALRAQGRASRSDG